MKKNPLASDLVFPHLVHLKIDGLSTVELVVLLLFGDLGLPAITRTPFSHIN